MLRHPPVTRTIGTRIIANGRKGRNHVDGLDQRGGPVRLSIITDEISQDLDRALEVCEDLGVRTVELRAIGGANVVSHDQSSLQRVKTTLEDRNFDVCA